MLDAILWIPKQIIFSHYVVLLNLCYPRTKLAQIEVKCDAFHEKLFGKGK
ncbi:hypothetical protein KSF73_09860 [Burkholderiaceae bacterium DAT-1]|nr:hypothetical protein [Burkholderiaceae bacterium DAT-1]